MRKSEEATDEHGWSGMGGAYRHSSVFICGFLIPRRIPATSLTMAKESAARRTGEAEAFSLLTDHDLYLFNEGSHFRLYEKLGAHPVVAGGEDGTYFAVWAPDAVRVFVCGDF